MKVTGNFLFDMVLLLLNQNGHKVSTVIISVYTISDQVSLLLINTLAPELVHNDHFKGKFLALNTVFHKSWTINLTKSLAHY